MITETILGKVVQTNQQILSTENGVIVLQGGSWFDCNNGSYYKRPDELGFLRIDGQLISGMHICKTLLKTSQTECTWKEVLSLEVSYLFGHTVITTGEDSEIKVVQKGPDYLLRFVRGEQKAKKLVLQGLYRPFNKTDFVDFFLDLEDLETQIQVPPRTAIKINNALGNVTIGEVGGLFELAMPTGNSTVVVKKAGMTIINVGDRNKVVIGGINGDFSAIAKDQSSISIMNGRSENANVMKDPESNIYLLGRVQRICHQIPVRAANS